MPERVKQEKGEGNYEIQIMQYLRRRGEKCKGTVRSNTLTTRDGWERKGVSGESTDQKRRSGANVLPRAEEK